MTITGPSLQRIFVSDHLRITKTNIMTTKTVKLIAFIVLLVHGIGHFQGVAAGLGLKINSSSPAQSWLLKSFSDHFNNGDNYRVELQ